MSSVRTVRTLLTDLLPHGRTLPQAEWNRRHRGILGLLCVLGIVLPAYDLLASHRVGRALGEAAVLLTTAVFASRLTDRRGLSSALSAAGLCSASGLVVYVAHGATEAHFMFFVLIIVVSLYEDWRPFLMFFSFVLAHHALLGQLPGDLVHTHSGDSPLALALVHGGFIFAAAVACIVQWRLNETVRAEGNAASMRASESDARFRSAFADGPVGMAIVGTRGAARGTLLRVNRTLCERFAAAADELAAADLSVLFCPDQRARVLAHMDALVARRVDVVHDELQVTRRDGTSFDGRVSMSLVGGAPATGGEVILQLEDVTEANQLRRSLQALADRDSLTGLFNRRCFAAAHAAQLASMRRYGGSGGAVLLIDLDHFKEINDTLSHEAGDETLLAVARILTGRLRSTDTIARLGGDEFVVLLPEATPEQAEQVAQELVTLIAERTVVGTGSRLRRTTASIGGVAYTPMTELTCDELLNDADLAMYEAKDRGGNGAVVYCADVDAADCELMSWPHRIRRALDDEQFTMYAQPILDLASGEVTRYELLLRMVGPDGNPIAPGAFLPVAERRGMIHAIDRWVMHQAIALLTSPGAHRSGAVLQVNISGRSLADSDFLADICAQLTDASVDPSKLVFEVTETAAIDNVQDAALFLRRLSDLGCGIALDDFGVGFGSLQHLKDLPINCLKIDGQFVRTLTTSPADRVVVEALVRMAGGLNMSTTAEYVEDEATLRLVRDMGVDFAQGYYVGRPGPAHEVIGTDVAFSTAA